MFRILLSTSVLFTIISVAASAQDARVRWVVLDRDAAPADVYLSDATASMQPIGSGLAYLQAGTLAPAGSGFDTIVVTEAGAATQVRESFLRFLGSSNAYTFFRMPDFNGEPLVLQEKRAHPYSPPAGMGAVATLHADAALDTITIRVISTTDTLAYRDLVYTGGSSHENVTAGPVLIEVARPGGELLFRGSDTIAEGELSTYIVTWTPAVGVHVSVLDDGDTSAQAELPELNPMRITRVEAATVSGLRLAPNPASQRTVLHYTLEHAGHVHAGLYDIAGRLVAEPLDAERPRGEGILPIDLTAVAPGRYTLRLDVDGTTRESMPIIVVR